jgi:hypothetical protein
MIQNDDPWSINQSTTRERSNPKYLHIKTFISQFVENNCDVLPINDFQQNPIRVLPFGSLKSFYEEYYLSSQILGDLDSSIGGLTLFRTVYKHEFESTLRLMRCKGNFSTCDICNNAADLLTDRKRGFTKEQRDIISKFRRLHLKQQADERENLANNRRKAKTDRDPGTGQPKCCLLVCDAITATRGDLPKIGTTRRGKQDINK